MSGETIFDDVTGLVIKAKSTQDLSTASVLKYLIRNPAGIVTEVDCELDPDDLTNKTMMYTCLATDFPEKGKYTIQPYIENVTFKGHGTMFTIRIGQHLVVTP